ncbi:MAG: DUF4878 domain-containing protein [Actinobacteria bacterium]|nr:DUF4878 domain-containing protein [Actinomycetota bacterium]
MTDPGSGNGSQSDQPGQPPYGTGAEPRYGQPPAYGQPSYGQPEPSGYAQQPPAYGQPSYGQPNFGQPEQPGYETAGYSGGQPPYGEPPAYGTGGYGPPPSGGAGHKPLIIGGAIVAALVVVGLVLYFALSGGSSSGGSTPAAAAKNFAEAAKHGDKSALLDGICSKERPLVTAAVAANPTIITEDLKLKSYSIGKTTQQDSTHATVSVTAVTATDNKAQTQDLDMVKEGGTWKVCPDLSALTGGSSLSTGGSTSSLIPTRSTSAGAQPSDPAQPSDSAGALPTDLSEACAGAQSTPLDVAAYFVGLAEGGGAQLAQQCVWHNAVANSTINQMADKDYTPKSVTNTEGPFVFSETGGGPDVTIKTAKESDGKYYVVGVTFG